MNTSTRIESTTGRNLERRDAKRSLEGKREQRALTIERKAARMAKRFVTQAG